MPAKNHLQRLLSAHDWDFEPSNNAEGTAFKKCMNISGPALDSANQMFEQNGPAEHSPEAEALQSLVASPITLHLKSQHVPAV